MSPDNEPVDLDLDDGMSPLERAQFAAMQNGGDVPETLPEAPGAQQQAVPETPDPATQQQQQPDPQAVKVPKDPNDDPNDPDIEVADPKTGSKQRRVSIHKYDRLRKVADEREQALVDLRKKEQEQTERFARLDERMRILNEALATPAGQDQNPQDEDPEPDAEKDIFGYVQWQGRQLKKANERIETFENQGREQAAEREIANTYQVDAARFAASEEGKAFADAYVYLIQQRNRELEIAGWTDVRKREQKIVQEEKGLVRGAIDAGQSPAKRIFELAKGRGFTPKVAPPPAQPQPQKDPNALDAGGQRSPAQQQQPQQRANGNGAQQPVQQPQAPNVKEEIENIRNGVDASFSLSNAGGSAPRQLTPEILADMSPEEFAEILDNLPRDKQMELLGN